MNEVIFLKVALTIFGALIGSFLNVVIHRIPRNESIVTPRSKCPQCQHMIRWYENIPILSYMVLLRGRCSKCRTAISIRYPLIELLIACIAFLLAPVSFSEIAIIDFIFYFSVACVFVAHFLIDIEFHILPDKINLYLLAITLPYVAFNFPIGHWVLGGLIGFLGPFIVTYLFYKIRGQIGLGGGDIKLYGILGLLLGPHVILQNIFLSCFLGSIIGIALLVTKKMGRDTPLAFGPYIIIAATMQIYFPQVLNYFYPF